MSKILTRDDILGADDLPTKDVQIPEWGGGTVRVRTMAAAERDEFEAAYARARQAGAPINLRARYAAACIVDEQGQPIFTEADVEKLGRKSADALDRVFGAISDLNKLGAGDVEEAAKN
ncbi:MAG TPA: hypothetical protein VIG90_09580 [Pedomonas sp.]|uniref:hypothetical protein n=1 Tax=Pedomonas sp. TaxID=2976421 RepID=UPI002F411C6F